MKGGIKLAKKKPEVRKNESLKQELDILVKKANRRVNALRKKGINSRALIEAQRTFSRKGSKKTGTLFKSDLKTREQILKEFGRVNQFLNDFTSFVTGARRAEKRDFQSLEGAFGANWSAEYGVNYDKSRIKDEYAKEAFRIYRLLQEEFTWERISGVFRGKESLIGYGSEVLINNIYDMIAARSHTETIMNRARSMVNNALERYDEMARNQLIDSDYGLLVDDPLYKNRKDYITKGMRG